MGNKTTRWIIGVFCFFLALVFLQQVLGLLFIQRIAIRAADPHSEARVPLSVRFVGIVADKLHRDVLKEPLDPDGSNWPSGFRWFFILELCGLAGIAIAFAQFGAGIIRQKGNWRTQARTVLVSSSLVLLLGICFLKFIGPDQQIPSPPQEFLDPATASRAAETGPRESPLAPLLRRYVLAEKVRGVGFDRAAFDSVGRVCAGVRVDEVGVWDAASGEQMATLAAREPTDLAFGPEGKRLATADRQGKVTIWSIPEGGVLHTHDAHDGEVASVTFSRDGKWLATAGTDQAANIWGTQTGERVANLEIEGVHCQEGKNWIAFSHDSQRLAVLSKAGSEIQFWDVSSGEISDRFVVDPADFGTRASSVAWNHDGSLLAVADLSNSLKIVDVGSLRTLEYPPASRDGIYLGMDRGAFRGSVFHPDGKHVAAFTESTHGGSISVWRISDGQEVLRLDDFADWVLAAAFNPDGNQLMAVGRGGTLTISAVSLPNDREAK